MIAVDLAMTEATYCKYRLCKAHIKVRSILQQEDNINSHFNRFHRTYNKYSFR